MTTHTKERWSVEGRGETFAILAFETDEQIAQVPYTGTGDDPTSGGEYANARRIVACVNACAGIPTEALEAGALAALVAEATETLRNIACADGVATGLTQDVEALEAALAKLREERQPLRVQIFPVDQETGQRGPLHWEGEFSAEVIEDDEERAEVEATLRASGAAMVGGGAMPLVLILRADG